MTNIVLATINAKWIHPSLALRLLKANLGSLEEDCKIVELALRQPLKEKVKPILAARPRLLGLSVSIWNHSATLELLKTLEEEWKTEQPKAGQKPVVVLGGPEVSWLPPDAEIFRYADYVIRGEGEESFRSLCFRIFNKVEDSTLLFSEIKNRNRTVTFIAHSETTVDVNKTVTAYHLYTEEDISRKLIYVEASRGCPFGCEFCLNAARHQELIGPGGLPQVREFPLEPFLADMETLIEKGVRTFKFLDRTFNLDIERAKKIMEFFLERNLPPKAEVPLIAGSSPKDRVPHCVHFEMVPSRFPLDLRELIRRFPPGSLRMELGIQTFNPQTRALVRLSGKIDEELETLVFLRRETNAIVHTDLIAGLPGEDFNSFGAGFDRLWQVMAGTSPTSGYVPFEIQLGILKCLPGTPITRHNETYGMRYSAEPPYEVIETGALSASELDRIKNFARFWELIVNRNSFPDIILSLLLPGEKAFGKFMDLSDRLRKQFGRNWGIDREELKSFLGAARSQQASVL